MPLVVVTDAGPSSTLCVPVTDLETYLQRAFTTAEEASAELVLDIACGLVRDYATRLPDTLPAVARAAVLNVATRLLATPGAVAASSSGVTQESIEGYSVTYATAASTSGQDTGIGQGFTLTTADKALLRRWHDAAGTVQVRSQTPTLHYLGSVKAASIETLTLSGLQTVDGTALVAGDRVLAKDQADASEGGVWVVAAGAWARALDADSTVELHNAVVRVSGGTTNGGTEWAQTTDQPTVDTSPIRWSRV